MRRRPGRPPLGQGRRGHGQQQLWLRLRRAEDDRVAFANATFGWIKAGQRSGFGGRYYSVDFSPGQHARVAEAYGVRSWRVTDPGELRGARAAALEAGGPTLVDVVSQPLQDARAPVSERVA